MQTLDKGLLLRLALSFRLPLLVLMLPIDAIPINDLTLVQHRLLAIFLLAALLWVLEPVPVFATSILIIALELVMISDKGLHPFRAPVEGHDLGHLLPYTEIFSAFSSPIIILFMGGFALAIAASKYELDNNLARVLLKPFGNQPKYIMLGLMLITSVFSMFMSNTATTVMMLALLGPIVASAPKGDLGIKALVLCIPIAANTGGIATPIGTPPNAIALQYLTVRTASAFVVDDDGFTVCANPTDDCLVPAAKLFPSSQPTMTLKLDGTFQRNWRAVVVYITFAATILLWMTTSLHGMNTYVVSIIPLAVFTLTGIMGKEELKQINWDVLWLVAGDCDRYWSGTDRTGDSTGARHRL